MDLILTAIAVGLFFFVLFCKYMDGRQKKNARPGYITNHGRGMSGGTDWRHRGR